MRVLIVTQYFWPESFSINALVKSMVKKGLEVDVLTGKPNYPEGSIFSGYRAWGCQREQWLVQLCIVCLFSRVACAATGTWRLITCRSL
jgi:hypothetical protein